MSGFPFEYEESVEHLFDVLEEHTEKLGDAIAAGLDPRTVCSIAVGLGDIARAICSLINTTTNGKASDECGCKERL